MLSLTLFLHSSSAWPSIVSAAVPISSSITSPGAAPSGRTSSRVFPLMVNSSVEPGAASGGTTIFMLATRDSLLQKPNVHEGTGAGAGGGWATTTEYKGFCQNGVVLGAANAKTGLLGWDFPTQGGNGQRAFLSKQGGAVVVTSESPWPLPSA